MNDIARTINDVDSRLAFDLATEMSDLPSILSRYSLSQADLKDKLNNPVFSRIYREAKALWNSELSIKERIRLKSQALVEDSLLELYTIFNDRDLATPARLEAFKHMAKVATVTDADPAAGPVGARVNITFNIPHSEPVSVQGGIYNEVSDDREAIKDSAQNPQPDSRTWSHVPGF